MHVGSHEGGKLAADRFKVTKKTLEEDVSIISHYSLTLPSSISPLLYSTIHGF